jgi:deazaflavin-dependent oxidoreductase (nitroreductase family)
MRWFRQLAMRAFIATHAALYALSDGRIGGRMGTLRILLLTSTGRRSGRARTVPLVFFEDGERLVVIASKGGAPRDPLWWENLQKRPEAVVQIGGEKRNMRARLASPEERARLWPRIKQENPAYAEYEKRTAREIPVVLLCV